MILADFHWGDAEGIPLAIIALLYAIKLILEYKEKKANGNGVHDRREADRIHRSQQSKEHEAITKSLQAQTTSLQAQTAVLTQISEQGKSTHTRTGRIAGTIQSVKSNVEDIKTDVDKIWDAVNRPPPSNP